MDSKRKGVRELEVWKMGIKIVKEVYGLTKNFPAEEQYGITSQMRRAAVSIPSNIAEGFRRQYDKEHKQFLSIALGSCAELETHMVIAKELSYINEEKEESLMELIDHICGMLVNLRKCFNA